MKIWKISAKKQLLPKERKGDSLYVVHIKNVHPKVVGNNLII
jgi:hypothetical protein